MLSLALGGCSGRGQPASTVVQGALVLQIQLTQAAIAEALQLKTPGAPEVSHVRVASTDAVRIGEGRGVHLKGDFDWRLAGDPVPLVLGMEATKADIEFYRRQYGLDKPLVMQYLTFLCNISQGDFGVSFRYRVPAIDLILPALWATFKLVSVAMLLAVAVGVPLGVLG